VAKIENSGLDHDQNTNVFKLYPYVNKNTHSYGVQKAMYGGIIKMETCNYVANIAQVGTNVYMLITRDTISIEYDDTLLKKITEWNTNFSF
jgi:helix-turn-helix protein